jgi:hypothetical protein
MEHVLLHALRSANVVVPGVKIVDYIIKSRSGYFCPEIEDRDEVEVELGEAQKDFLL